MRCGTWFGARLLHLQHLAETEDGIERRAQLVAHAGEEIALRAVRAVGRFLRVAQGFLDPLLFGHIVRDADEDFIFRRPARGPEDVDDGAVFAEAAVHKIAPFASGFGSLLRLPRPGAIFRMHEHEITAADQFIRLVAPEIAAGGVRGQEPSLFVQTADHILRIVHDQEVRLVGGGELLVCFLERDSPPVCEA